MRKKSLSELLAGFPVLTGSIPEAEITGIAVDSRAVEPGDVFVATSDRIDGHQFIPQAIERGAAAVIGSQALELAMPDAQVPDAQLAYAQVEDSRGALAHISAKFYDNPASKLTLIGVTGTDGKTSTVNFLFNILQAAGIPVGMISTVNAVIGDQDLDTGFHVTTPEAYNVQKYLRQMVDAGLTHAILETTSHGLAARRVLGSDFDIGVVTNITHEHLNDHGSYQAYFDAKARLIEGLVDEKGGERLVPPLAVLNRDDRSFHPLAERAKVKAVSYGQHTDADVTASEIENTPELLSFTAHGPGFDFPVETSMIGNYNVWNALAAISAAVIGLGISPEAAQAGIRALGGVPGRMERIEMGQDFLAIVDFAHTPYALEAALQAGRKLTGGQIIAVFGSAGLRDKLKRRMMAEVSAQFADLTVLTAEDPRTESLDDILGEMAEGARSKGAVEGESFFRVRDRGEAIRFALQKAQPGDLVMALGKGHEQSMCFIETEYLWDDRTAMRAALADLLGVEGPEMPYLPTQDE